ncbi:hypothetical protein BKA67DRAFT_536077 [Truncatella angustata]|uniref:Uncharacterized protein n=1 Tax=Truncatella angustata TaxID=152316 RepID=A0A9P8UMS8_9PEZI|nr:uncharacterized protein BKA67DRAFT_536077 [Truncatella angustata]KAH6654780.1 hypothetical protein BKA67DRAFT_536077 [Truncatella angustata]
MCLYKVTAAVDWSVRGTRYTDMVSPLSHTDLFIDVISWSTSLVMCVTSSAASTPLNSRRNGLKHSGLTSLTWVDDDLLLLPKHKAWWRVLHIYSIVDRIRDCSQRWQGAFPGGYCGVSPRMQRHRDPGTWPHVCLCVVVAQPWLLEVIKIDVFNVGQQSSWKFPPDYAKDGLYCKLATVPTTC